MTNDQLVSGTNRWGREDVKWKMVQWKMEDEVKRSKEWKRSNVWKRGQTLYFQ